MTHSWHGALVLGALLLGAAAGCKDDPAAVITDPGVTESGLNFQLAGATLTSVPNALPTADASFSAPVVRVDRSPTSTVPATISISAVEPFQTVLVQPNGSSSYVRIFLPAQTQLIGVNVLIRAAGSPTVATSLTIAVGSGTRTSRTSVLSLLSLGN